ncbi:RNA-binding S4 domain-containing protein [Crenothrix sp.]|uniref:RNA-binding S4 domain-containing protein n=1 Tax=Crenothrix sp. TaxID=3100433 RepID=UPI00374CFB72
MPAALDAVRLDKWLWAARFFKTRSLAAEAIAGGKVHINNHRAKPGKEIKPGVAISISHNGYKWDITVVTVIGQRCAAKEAVLLYEETPESHEKRQQQILQQRENREFFDLDNDHKPNKKDRRLIHRFKQQDF